MLLKITSPDELDQGKLMFIYSEGNAENAEYFYPEIEDKKEAVKKVENDFCNFLRTEFFNGENIYCVSDINGVWVSALRLNKIEEGFYYLEALETAPQYRKKGYASELLREVISDLKKSGKFKIRDCVGKKNIASINTHEKCGFKIISENGYDYLQNETDERCYGFEYEFKG